MAFFERQVALFTQEDAGHGGFFGYHFVVLLSAASRPRFSPCRRC
jgi:hypothetical protein